MARAYYHISTIVGIGTDADPKRPADLDAVLSWAATYNAAQTEAVVMVDAPDPLALKSAGTFLGAVGDMKANIGTVSTQVRDLIRQFSGAATADWHDTFAGDWTREDELTQDEYTRLVLCYPAWAAGKAYKVGDLCQYQGTLYEVLQAHTSQSDWTPDIVPALFVRRSPAGVIPLWVKPTGAHDAVALGALVIFNGKVYESLIPANVYSPTEYPAGWRVR